MKVKYGYLDQQFLEVDEYFDDLRELVTSGEFTLGPYVEKFERKFADYIGAKHVISTNTGTGALILAFKGSGVKPGDEVITVTNTFYATVGAIVAVGAKPVFVDCDERFQMDANLIEEAITEKTTAIVPVHWAGCPPDMERIVQIARGYNLVVIEDACPAVGAKISEKFAGTFGEANAFSMHPLKPLNVWGDGGMITTENDDIAEWLLKYRNHGMVDRDHIEFWGINCRLQPVQAIVGSRLLNSIEKLVDLRIRNARLLDQGLRNLDEFITIPHRPEGYREVYQLYQVCVQRRKELIPYLEERGIESKIHYPIPLHLQEAAKELGYKLGDFPVSEKQADEILTIPAHQHITPEQIEYTVETIRSFYLS